MNIRSMSEKIIFRRALKSGLAYLSNKTEARSSGRQLTQKSLKFLELIMEIIRPVKRYSNPPGSENGDKNVLIIPTHPNIAKAKPIIGIAKLEFFSPFAVAR